MASAAALPTGPVRRAKDGRWLKGSGGNPTGLMAKRDVASLARKHTRMVVSTLAAIVKDKEEASKDRIAAGKVLLDRGWGKSPHVVDITMGLAGNADLLAGAAARVLARREAAISSVDSTECIDATFGDVATIKVEVPVPVTEPSPNDTATGGNPTDWLRRRQDPGTP